MFDQSNGQQQQMGGYFYNGYPAQAQPKVMNYLTAEEIEQLQKKEGSFNLCLTETESLQARCNHRTKDGVSDALKLDPITGEATCTICGYKFRPVDTDTSMENIIDATNKVVDILQTIKLLYTDLPAQAAIEYFQIIPLITKIPKLFEFACKAFSKHEYNAWSYNQANMGGMALLANLQNGFGGGFGFGQQPQFNAYAPQPNQPVGYPQQQPMMGANPFGYPGAQPVQPMMGGYQPQNPGYQFQPGQAAPVAPAAAPVATPEAAPAPTAETTVTNTVTV